MLGEALGGRGEVRGRWTQHPPCRGGVEDGEDEGHVEGDENVNEGGEGGGAEKEEEEKGGGLELRGRGVKLTYPAWSGLAWPGLAWLGLAWLGLAWLGLAWLGLAWLGLVFT